MRFILLAALCAAAAASCDSDFDCSLNGLCQNSACICDPPWHGPFCSLLLPAPAPITPAFGLNSTNRGDSTTSWGATVLLRNATFHMFLAEMVNHCGLNDWTSASRCTHATSASPLGPFTFTDVAVEVWCHNPHVVEDPATGELFMFHLGNGTHTGAEPNCSRKHDGIASEDPKPADSGSTLHMAQGPNGPWLPVDLPLPASACNNPAPLRLANGTWLLACARQRQLLVAPSPRGPWVAAGAMPTGKNQQWEDPVLWEDARSNIHALFHAYTLQPSPPAPGTCAGNPVSAHAFSRDGAVWGVSDDAPYNNTFLRADGVTITAATLERPKLGFWGPAPSSPTHLYNGAAGLPGGEPGCTGTCNRCKLEGWDYTLARELT